MAQFDFIGTWTDSWAVLSAILEPGDIRLVQNLKYEIPILRFLTTIEEIHALCLEGNCRFFVASEMFTRHPPCLERIESGVNSGRYSVNYSKGGPLLDLMLPFCYRYEAGVPIPAFDGGLELHLAVGILMYQKLYLSPTTQKWESPSDSVKAGYKEILRRIKTRLVRHCFHEPIWAGIDALHQIQSNNATIHGFGLD